LVWKFRWKMEREGGSNEGEREKEIKREREGESDKEIRRKTESKGEN